MADCSGLEDKPLRISKGLPRTSSIGIYKRQLRQQVAIHVAASNHNSREDKIRTIVRHRRQPEHIQDSLR
jgi:hypothetical protein